MGSIPPTCGCEYPEENALGWVSPGCQKITGKYILKTNSGFGGINAALVLAF
jgi:3-oxoacyl-[acyl-carrier-protein] synthase II